jgi:hypothetical protein
MTTETEGAAPEAVTEETLAPEAAEVVETPADEAGAAAETEAEAPQPKPKKTAQERFDELTREKHEAKREAEYWRTEAERRQQAEAPKPEPKGDGAPDPSDYVYGETDAAYIRDHATHVAKQTVRQEMAQQQAQAQLQSQVASFEARMAQQYPDGEPAGITAIKRMTTLSEGIVQPILASDIGPKLADHLGSNPAELRRLSGLSPALQAYELGKLETKLASKVQPKTLTNAPEPTPTVRGAGGQFKAAPDTDDFAAFEKAYSK